MKYWITKGDYKFLTHIVDYKVLSVEQLSAICQNSHQMIRKRIRNLVKEGFIVKDKKGYGHAHGRPKELIFLTEKCIDLLKNIGMVSDKNISFEDVTVDSKFIGHELLVNWFRIHLLQIDRSVPKMKVNHLSPIFLFLAQRNEYLKLRIIENVNGKEKVMKFSPDGVFTISNGEKTLLFFLEVDMGTEVVASLKRSPNDIRQKIINYQTFFRANQYKHYEKIFEAKINGLRLLFLTNTRARMVEICRLVRDMPPSNFIWLTEQKKMFSNGLSADIWARGGCYEDPLQSIIGKYSCVAPVLNTSK